MNISSRKNISSRINLDVADPGVGKLQMTAYVKNAYLQYKTDKLSTRFGMIAYRAVQSSGEDLGISLYLQIISRII